MNEAYLLTLFNVDKTCRVCLEEKNLGATLLRENYTVIQMIENCSSVKISLNDGLPPMLCDECFYRLEVAYQFKQQCEVSDMRLREYFGMQQVYEGAAAALKTDLEASTQQEKNEE